MVLQSPSSGQAPRRVGVGIDTARYGHVAAFLGDDLQPAAADLAFAESAAGYALLGQRLEQIATRLGQVAFVVRLDAAGQYADNLLHFVHGLAGHFALTVSCGDPQRNKNYRAALFGTKKSDPIEAQAAARFAVTERPHADTPLSLAQRTLRQVAGRLQAVVRQRTRLINQLHHLLALTFPELALLTKDLASGWALELLHRYPTAQRLAQASQADIAAVPYLSDILVQPLLEHAHISIASLTGPAAEELVRDQVRQLRDVTARQKRLEKLLSEVYQTLPSNHLASIPAIGPVTAAVLTAFIVDIRRFTRPGKLVAYFGILPIEAASAVDRDGTPRGPKRYVMSRRGNDLVRRYLWMAALSAIRCNPAVRALYARVVAKHPNAKAVAVGHAMRKLLHLVWAIWMTDRSFSKDYYPWHAPLTAQEQAAGLTPDEPEWKQVTAACVDSIPHDEPGCAAATVDFAHLKRQLSLARVLDQLGLLGRLRGTGPQRRCACPIHRGDARGRTFSVNLDANVFQCFAKDCAANGDVIDLWSQLRGLSLREAALDLVRTFALEATPPNGTGKRHG